MNLIQLRGSPRHEQTVAIRVKNSIAQRIVQGDYGGNWGADSLRLRARLEEEEIPRFA